MICDVFFVVLVCEMEMVPCWERNGGNIVTSGGLKPLPIGDSLKPPRDN